MRLLSPHVRRNESHFGFRKADVACSLWDSRSADCFQNFAMQSRQVPSNPNHVNPLDTRPLLHRAPKQLYDELFFE